ncbi:MAG TPA: preprotein translocase subunit SecG [Candidatus Rubrimentiphilum sp.]|nr:preprotein translocase subunit SecG [Candidatus Rubrimentiphilum sp.]
MIWLFAAAAAAKPAARPTANPLQIQQTLPAPQPIAAPPAQTWFQLHAGWLTHGLAGLFIIAAVGLVVMLAIQTTKQEGLSGTIGGRVESAYSRMGAEEQLKRITGVFAVMFVVLGTILSLTGI